jgi:hypothetical protein
MELPTLDLIDEMSPAVLTDGTIRYVLMPMKTLATIERETAKMAAEREAIEQEARDRAEVGGKLPAAEGQDPDDFDEDAADEAADDEARRLEEEDARREEAAEKVIEEADRLESLYDAALDEAPEAFTDIYQYLADDGVCDDPGGEQFHRVLTAWFTAGQPEDMLEFINWQVRLIPPQEQDALPGTGYQKAV